MENSPFIVTDNGSAVALADIPVLAMDNFRQELIEAVPCAKLHSQTRNGSTVKLQCSYVGSSADFEDFFNDYFGFGW